MSSMAEGSLLLWALATGVALLAAHVSLGWLRQVQRRPQPRTGWRVVLLAAAVLGTGLCSSVVLGLAGAALPFPIGFHMLASAGLWLAAVLACLPALAWLAMRPGGLAYAGSGLLMAGAVVGVQGGWIWAAGFRPGIVWRAEGLAVAAVLMTIGFGAAFALADSIGARQARRRLGWRLAADGLAGLTLIAGQEIVVTSAGLQAQLSSVYQHDLPASVLSLLGGVVVPIVLSMMALDLLMRRRLRRRRNRNASSTLSPEHQRQRQRRRKHRTYRV